LQEQGYVVLQNVSGKDNCADIGMKNLSCDTFEQLDDYYKEWHCTTGAKKEGVTGLAIFELLDRLTDRFSHSDGLEWVQDWLGEPMLPSPTTIYW
jgi:hypothetical protein